MQNCPKYSTKSAVLGSQDDVIGSKCWKMLGKTVSNIVLGIMKNLHHGLWGNFHVIVEQKAEIWKMQFCKIIA